MLPTTNSSLAYLLRKLYAIEFVPIICVEINDCLEILSQNIFVNSESVSRTMKLKVEQRLVSRMISSSISLSDILMGVRGSELYRFKVLSFLQRYLTSVLLSDDPKLCE